MRRRLSLAALVFIAVAYPLVSGEQPRQELPLTGGAIRVDPALERYAGQRWEYRVRTAADLKVRNLSTAREIEFALNREGAEGWRLDAVFDPEPIRPATTFVFSRPKDR